MNVRIDSPFAKLTQDQQDMLVEVSEQMTAQQMVELVSTGPVPIKCSIPAMRRFLRRAQENLLMAKAKEAEESVAELAKQGEDPKVREATLTTARQRMYEDMMETSHRPALLEMFAALNEEKAKDREFMLEERKVRVAEEHAKLGWKKLEHDRAISAAKLLPKVWLILTDAKMDAQERVVRAQECLAQEGARLLPLPELVAPRAEAAGEKVGG